MIENKLPKASLQTWVDDYKETTPLRETKNVLIVLDELISFVDEIKKLNTNGANINAVRAYFVRQDDLKNKNGIAREKITGNHSQISIAVLPVIKYARSDYKDKKGVTHKYGGAEDYFDKNDDTILCLTPGDKATDHEHTGLCPYNCGDSL